MPVFVRNALIAFVITLALIGTVAYAVNYLNRQRIAELTAIEEQISIETLSLDTRFSLLEAAPCDNASSTDITGDLTDLGNRLAYTEDQLGRDNAQVIRLKQQYSLLEIRDYLVTKKLAAACGTKPVTVLYFYSNAGACPDCDKAGYALSYLRDTYPTLRVYSFDYHLGLGALETLIAIEKVREEFPAFVINGTASYGYTSLADFEKRFPKGSLPATSASTSAPKPL